MVVDMPYRSAASFAPFPFGTVARISATISIVSLWALAGFVIACRTPRALACALFCRGVLHSKLVSRLFCLLPSLWLTHGRRGAGGRKVAATKRCIRQYLRGPLSATKHTSRYPLSRLTLGRSILGSPKTLLRTRPKLLTSYLGKPMTCFHISIFNENLSYHKLGE